MTNETPIATLIIFDSHKIYTYPLFIGCDGRLVVDKLGRTADTIREEEHARHIEEDDPNWFVYPGEWTHHPVSS